MIAQVDLAQESACSQQQRDTQYCDRDTGITKEERNVDPSIGGSEMARVALRLQCNEVVIRETTHRSSCFRIQDKGDSPL